MKNKFGNYNKNISYIILILPFVYFFILGISFLVSILQADLYIKKGRTVFNQGKYESALYYFDKAIEYNPRESFYYENRARVLAYLGLLSDKSEDKKILKTLALKDLEYSKNMNPNNLRVVRNNISTYYLLAILNNDNVSSGTKDKNDFAEETRHIDIDYNFRDITKRYFYDVKTMYKNDAGVLVDIARYERKLNWEMDFNNTKLLIEKIRPDLLEWHEDLINY